jgi:peptidyl-prolyl cis-trans isomerase B (cyclophilin B)
MSSRRRIGPILALAAAVLLAGCGGGKPKTDATQTIATTSGTTQATALDASKTYTVTMKTNKGIFAFVLNIYSSPHTTQSFASLVREGYFDGTVFHRIVPGWVIQGGDPTGTGTGGPGYSTVDVPPSNAVYTRGVVAMAKGGNEPPGTAGSQFFIVTAKDARLPPIYALLGNVTSGLDVVEKIGRLGDPQREQPTERVVIEKATLSES